MKIVKIKGGLGNQMFQYAFAKKVENLTNETIKLDFSTFGELSDDQIRKPRLLQYNLSLEKANEEEINAVCKIPHKGNSLSVKYKLGILLESIVNKKYFFERDRRFRAAEKLVTYDYFDGYWQSWKHINSVIGILQKEFTPNYEINQETKSTIKKMQAENSVFVGVRKGDYALKTNHYGIFQQEYYDRALECIENAVKNPVYYIFSNDISWVKNNLKFGKRNVIYREKEDVVNDFEELILMTNCKHSIIVNSTYHWWGARMNYYPGKIVVAPKKWFFDDKPIDIIPPEWKKI
jgi:hypothetical protein